MTGTAGIVPRESSYTYHLSELGPTHESTGGSVKVLDPTTFPLAAGFSTAVVTVKPGAMRELHWHTTSDEWNFFLQGSARSMSPFLLPCAFQRRIFLKNIANDR